MSINYAGATVARPAPQPRSSRRFGTGSFTADSQVEEALNSLASVRVIVPRNAEVRDYLLRHSDLCDLLPAICSAVRERFGAGTQLSLEVYRDSEIEDEYLSLYVRQQRYAPDIMQSIEEIRGCYEEELAVRSGWLLVTTDFRSPR